LIPLHNCIVTVIIWIPHIGFHKRSGTPANELVYCLTIWVWLKVDSVGMFARESLKTFSCAEKDALYAA